MLHEPHAKPDTPNDPSAVKTLMASRTIVELMYTLGSTNYDVTLLDLQVFVSQFFVHASLVPGLTNACIILDVLVHGRPCLGSVLESCH